MLILTRINMNINILSDIVAIYFFIYIVNTTISFCPSKVHSLASYHINGIANFSGKSEDREIGVRSNKRSPRTVFIHLTKFAIETPNVDGFTGALRKGLWLLRIV